MMYNNFNNIKGPSCNYNYLCNQCLSPLKLCCEFESRSWRSVLDTTLCD